MRDKCSVPRCTRPSDLMYYGRPVCDKCFTRHAERVIDLHVLFGIPRETALPDPIGDSQ